MMDKETAIWIENRRQEMVQDLLADPKMQAGLQKLKMAFVKLNPDEQTEIVGILSHQMEYDSPFSSALTEPLADDDDINDVYMRILDCFTYGGPKGALKTVQEVIGVVASAPEPQRKLPGENRKVELADNAPPLC